MLGNFLGGLANLGGISAGVDDAQLRAYKLALQQLAVQQARTQQQAVDASLPTVRALAAMQQQTAPPGPTPLPQPIQQQPLAPLPQNMQQMASLSPQVSQTDGAMGGQLPTTGLTARGFGAGGPTGEPTQTPYQPAPIPPRGGGGADMPGRMTPTQIAEGQQPLAQPASGAGLSVPQLGMQLASANQTYQQLRAAIPPQVQQPAMQGAQSLLQSMGNPLQFAGRLSLDDLVKAIDKANPNADERLKSAIFTNLYPMLNTQGKLGFSEAIQLLRVEQQGQEFTQRESQQRQEFDIRQQELQQQREFTRTIAGQRLAQGQERIDISKAKTQEQTDPATIEAVAKGIAEYRQAPLSGWTMRSPWGQAVMAKVYQDNPDYSASQFAAGMSGARAFATGRQADIVRSMSVAIDHLGVAEDLGKALQTGDSRALNAATAALKTQFGYEGPVDFNTARMIVGDEVTKAVAGGTLSMTERTALQDQFSTASSPEQLNGVIGTLKRLLGGQLRGLQRQYENIPGSKPSFESKLSPQAKEQLEGAAPGAPNIGTATLDQLDQMLAAGGLTPEQLGQVQDRIGQLESARRTTSP